MKINRSIGASTSIRLLLVLLAVMLCSNAWARDKTDIIWLINGDRLTGEIKQLEHGLLSVKTNSLGTVSIEWADIVRIESDYVFQFERTDGIRITGFIQQSPNQQEILVTDEVETKTFAHENVVRMSQIEQSFWDRLKGSLSFGYNITKASSVAQGNVGFAVTHRTEIRSWSLDGSTIMTSDQANESSRRSDLGLNLTRFRKNRWLNSFMVGFESNDELGLNLRTSIEASGGRFLIQTNTSELKLAAGLVGTDEILQGDVSSQQNLEGVLRMDYSRYIYDDPKLNLSAGLAVFPSITDAGRTRTQLDIDLRWELYKDLYWNLNFYDTYDSDPPSGSDSTSDYGVVTSLGWSF